MTWGEAIMLVVAATVAGLMNAVAGGGTLVTFPALLLLGTSSLVANATNTLALVLGTLGGVYGYRRQLASVRPWLTRFVPVSIVGGLVGAILLTVTGEQIFSRLIPFLLLFATVVLIILAESARHWWLYLTGRKQPVLTEAPKQVSRLPGS